MAKTIKRRSRFKDQVPSKILPKRAKGEGMAYLIEMERGRFKKLDEAEMDLKEIASSCSEDLPGTSTSVTVQEGKPKKCSKRNPVNLTSPLLREPFYNGWKREVVYRATIDTSHKTLCDVYYFTPEGKKLRSGKEVAVYLHSSGSHLTVENFSFFKEVIGMNAEQEIVRSAKKRTKEEGEMIKKERATFMHPTRKFSMSKPAKLHKEKTFKCSEDDGPVTNIQENEEVMPQSPKIRKRKMKQRSNDIQCSEEELIRNLQELGGVIAEAIENAKISIQRRKLQTNVVSSGNEEVQMTPKARGRPRKIKENNDELVSILRRNDAEGKEQLPAVPKARGRPRKIQKVNDESDSIQGSDERTKFVSFQDGGKGKPPTGVPRARGRPRKIHKDNDKMGLSKAQAFHMKALQAQTFKARALLAQTLNIGSLNI